MTDPARGVSIERFTGFVESVRGDLAYVELVNEDGQPLAGTYPAAELLDRGVRERDTFLLETIDDGSSVRILVSPIPRRILSAEQRLKIRDDIRRDLGDDTSDDDF